MKKLLKFLFLIIIGSTLNGCIQPAELLIQPNMPAPKTHQARIDIPLNEGHKLDITHALDTVSSKNSSVVINIPIDWHIKKQQCSNREEVMGYCGASYYNATELLITKELMKRYNRVIDLDKLEQLAGRPLESTADVIDAAIKADVDYIFNINIIELTTSTEILKLDGNSSYHHFFSQHPQFKNQSTPQPKFNNYKIQIIAELKSPNSGQIFWVGESYLSTTDLLLKQMGPFYIDLLAQEKVDPAYESRLATAIEKWNRKENRIKRAQGVNVSLPNSLEYATINTLKESHSYSLKNQEKHLEDLGKIAMQNLMDSIFEK